MATLLTLNDTAAFLSISRRTLTRYRAREDFPRPVKVSPLKVYFIKEELVKWAKGYRVAKKQ